jgi:hypothetical protein
VKAAQKTFLNHVKFLIQSMEFRKKQIKRNNLEKQKPSNFPISILDGLDPFDYVTSIDVVIAKKLYDNKKIKEDKYWRDTALLILLNSAFIAQAYEITPHGSTAIVNGMQRFYSPLWIYAIASSAISPRGIAGDAAREIYRLMDGKGPQYEKMSEFLDSEVIQSIE